MSTSPAQGRRAVLPKYKIHWHVVFTHFPISFFMLSFGFMALHHATARACFELSAYVSLLAGAAAMLPTALSGWLTWKGRYRGMKGKVFIYKMRIAFAMIALSFLLVFIRSVFPDALHTGWLWLYSFGMLLLLLGAGAEGYYGGRLNHR
jgi:hypothetical protein